MNLNYRVLFQGRHATQDEVAASAFQAVDLDQKYGGAPVQVRVTMGKEPRHFMAVFKGKMVIFEVRLLWKELFLPGVYSFYNSTEYLSFFLLGRHI